MVVECGGEGMGERGVAWEREKVGRSQSIRRCLASYE